MRGWWLLLLLFSPQSFSSRCLSNNNKVHSGAPVVATRSGQVVGTRKEAVDPRQNVTVSWTAYYVCIILTSLVDWLSSGSSLCSPTSWPPALSSTATPSILGLPKVGKCLEYPDLIYRDASEESGVVCPQVLSEKELDHVLLLRQRWTWLLVGWTTGVYMRAAMRTACSSISMYPTSRPGTTISSWT